MDAINELECRELAPRGTPTRGATACTCPRCLGVFFAAVGVTVQDAVTHFRGQERGYVDDTPSAAWFSLPRVQAGEVHLSSVVPPNVRSCNATAQTVLMAGWLLMHGFVVALDCMVGPQGVVMAGSARVRGALFVVPKKDGPQRLIFWTLVKQIITLRSHHARPLWAVRAQLPPHATLFNAQGDIECCFYQLELPHWLGQCLRGG